MVNEPQRQYAAPDDQPSLGFAFLGFLIPIVGFIVFLVSKKNTPRKAGSAGKGALLGCGLQILSFVILMAILLPVFAKAKANAEKRLREGNSVTFSSSTEFKLAIMSNDTDKVKALLQKEPTLATKPDFMGDSPLADTVVPPRVEIARLLLQYGADPNLKNKDGDSPLSQAKAFNQTEMIKLFETYKPKK